MADGRESNLVADSLGQRIYLNSGLGDRRVEAKEEASRTYLARLGYLVACHIQPRYRAGYWSRASAVSF